MSAAPGESRTRNATAAPVPRVCRRKPVATSASEGHEVDGETLAQIGACVGDFPLYARVNHPTPGRFSPHTRQQEGLSRRRTNRERMPPAGSTTAAPRRQARASTRPRAARVPGLVPPPRAGRCESAGSGSAGSCWSSCSRWSPGSTSSRGWPISRSGARPTSRRRSSSSWSRQNAQLARGSRSRSTTRRRSSATPESWGWSGRASGPTW